MPTLTITLPDDLADFIAQQVAERAFPDLSDYLESLVLQDWLSQNRERIDALLIEGLDSGPATPFTPQDWEAMRQRLEDRLAARHGS